MKCQVSSPDAAQERRSKFTVSLFSEANEVHAQDNYQQLAFGIAPQAQCNVKKYSTLCWANYTHSVCALRYHHAGSSQLLVKISCRQ